MMNVNYDIFQSEIFNIKKDNSIESWTDALETLEAMTRADVSSNFLLVVKMLGKFRKKTSTKLIIIFPQKKN